MHDEEALAVELHDQVLAPAPERVDALAAQLDLDLRRRARRTPERIEHLGLHDRPPRHARRELAANRLYLGELGHAPKQ